MTLMMTIELCFDDDYDDDDYVDADIDGNYCCFCKIRLAFTIIAFKSRSFPFCYCALYDIHDFKIWKVTIL